MNEEKAIDIKPFLFDTFNKEDQKYIPKLAQEFVIPKNLHSICNEISKGDCLALLFHGPAGTGKAMLVSLYVKKLDFL